MFITYQNSDIVLSTEEKNDWYKIKSGSITGWVSAEYVQLTTSGSSGSGSDSNTSTTESKTGKTTANLNVRASASTSASIITTLPKGTTITITGEQSGWYRIKSGSITAWVSKCRFSYN